MPSVFICYSHKDEEFVDEVTHCIEFDTDLTINIDKEILRPGKSTPKEIFGKIRESEFFVPVLSLNWVESNWCHEEAESAVIEKIEKNTEIIPILKKDENFEEVMEEMEEWEEVFFEKLWVARFDENFNTALNNFIKEIGKKCDKTPKQIYSEMESSEDNPFRWVRAEQFHDPRKFRKYYAEPELQHLKNSRPLFLVGGRGAGKTMILKSLDPSFAISKEHAESWGQINLPIFGIYFKASRGSFSPVSKKFLDEISSNRQIFIDELLLRLSRTLLEILWDANKKDCIQISKSEEKEICRIFSSSLRLPSDVKNIDNLKNCISEEISKITDYVSSKERGENPSYLVNSLEIDRFKKLCKKILDELSSFSDKSYFCFLIDEYENLTEIQQEILNTLIKFHEGGIYTFKVASKPEGNETLLTLEQEEIEEGEDFDQISLDFNLNDKISRREYKQYVFRISENILSSENFEYTDITEILEDREEYREKNGETPEGLSLKEIDEEIKEIYNNRIPDKKWCEIATEKREETKDKMWFGAKFRLLGNKRCRYGGFDDFIVLSSGIVRRFVELCGLAYHFSIKNNKNIKDGEDDITIQEQTEAAYQLSKLRLSLIKKNVELYGPYIFDFVNDIGDIIHEKLMTHRSEPDSSRFKIRDPNKLKGMGIEISENGNQKEIPLNEIFSSAVTHSIFKRYGGKGSSWNKNVATTTQEYILNRIYAPALKISPWARWYIMIEPKKILNLLKKKEKTKRELIKKVRPSDVRDEEPLEAFTGVDDAKE